MLLSKRRIILIGVVAAVVGAIVLLPLILTITLPSNLNSIAIKLTKVETMNNVTASDSQVLHLNVFFSMYNPTDKSLTTSKIEYRLYANGRSLGTGLLSYEDVPVNGRPQLLPSTNTTLQSPFEVRRSGSDASILKLIENPSLVKSVRWRVDGVADIESGFSSSPKQFTAHL
jgi:LEA14-like dessication related protein